MIGWKGVTFAYIANENVLLFVKNVEGKVCRSSLAVRLFKKWEE